MAYEDQTPGNGQRTTTQSDQDERKRVASDASDRAKDVAGTAQKEAAQVKETAAAAGSDVADTATQEAGNVAHEVGQQSRRIMDEGVSELQSQAGAGQQRVAELSRSLGGELKAMTNNTDQSGPMTDLAGSAQRMLDDAATWLERSEPSDVLQSVRRYAARNPWQFLAISAGVGFVGARIYRGLQDADDGTQPRPDSNRQVGRGGESHRTAPVADQSFGSGPRYAGEAEAAETLATPFSPLGEAGPGGIQGTAPSTNRPGGTRGL